jgi:ribosomal protein L7/L12
MLNARRQFLIATREEVLMWIGNKVQAMRMYRERTGSGLYEAKKQLEEGERNLQSQATEKHGNVEVTSCG